MVDSLLEFRRLLSDPNLRRLQLAGAVSVASAWTYATGLSVFAYTGGGPAEVGLVWLLLMVPAAVAAPLLAYLADCRRAERVLALSCACRAGLLLICAACVYLALPRPLVYALAIPASVLSRLAYPAQAALLPALVRDHGRLAGANALLTQVESLATVVGPAVGGLLLALGGVAGCLALAGLGVALAAVLAARIDSITSVVKERAAPRRALRTELLAGMSEVAHTPALRLLVGLFAAQTLLAGALSVLTVVVAFRLLGASGSSVGLLNAALGAGGVLGGLLLLGRDTKRLAQVLRLGLLLWGLPLAGLAFAPGLALALAAFAVIGVANSLVDVATFTLLQQLTADDVRARVFGLLEGASVGAIALGAGAAPLLVAAIGTRSSLIACALLLPALVACCWQSFDRLTSGTNVDETRSALAGRAGPTASEPEPAAIA